MGRAGRYWITSIFVMPLIICASVSAQETDPRRSATGHRSVDGVEQSRLAKDNDQRVAASAAQIKSVLLIDPGLMVELKRYLAKEATDNGQIIDDTALTDFGIFQRL